MKPIVPWTVAWTGEDASEVRPCRWAGGNLALWSPHRPGEGRPIYAEMHMVRQRRSIREMRCSLCGEKTPVTDRWWFRLGRIQDGHFMTEEAPLHRACADRAAVSCPHLRDRAQDLEPFPIDYRVLASVIAGPSAERDFGVKIGARTVIGALKLAWPVPASVRGVIACAPHAPPFQFARGERQFVASAPRAPSIGRRWPNSTTPRPATATTRGGRHDLADKP